MKKLFTLLFASVVLGAHAQTTIYSETFNTGSGAWTLNTPDLGGASPLNNQWTINNIYFATSMGTVTPDQPSGIVGYPKSRYMHMYCGPTYATLFGTNCNFVATNSGETYFTAMTTPISTLGYTGVTLSFWWICNGSSTSAGKVFFRTAPGGAWTQITSPTATYYGNSTWLQQTIVMSALDNLAFLEFGFQFTNGTSGGSDPAFGVDDIAVIGYSAATVPTASYVVTPNDTVCADSCITFTSTSAGGAVDSVKWAVTPSVTMTSTTANPLTVCFPTTATYTVTLTSFGAGGSSNSVQSMYIKPKPNPTIAKSGHTLTVPAGYTSYQWYNGTTPIAAATNNTYTYTGTGNFRVVVDSGSCRGTSNNNINTAGIGQLSSAENAFWTSRDQKGLTIWSKGLLKESVDINIYDAVGRRIAQEQWAEGSDMKVLSDLLLAPGLYIIRLSDHRGGVVSLKFVE